MNNTSEQWMAHFQQGDTEELEHLYLLVSSTILCMFLSVKTFKWDAS
ncbi:hypothetical protein ACFFGV_04200 [Pontibacillus salicampi]|uniref:Uncharacterized protein n=1 Tax=Pontibacillus salicampi TaxID=1449801 RepID=A0ABV6LK69_9BACI